MLDRIYKEFSSLRLFLTGVAMGGADLIPGVSGGTIAFILGIYEALLSAIKSINADFFKACLSFRFLSALKMIPWRFGIALGSGIAVAILGMASTLSNLLKYHQTYLFSFFFGLIIASIITVSMRVKWNIVAFLSLIIGTVLGYEVVGLVPSEMPHTAFNLFWTGMVAIMAMILPGISGSFIMLILGQYNYVLEAVKNFDFLTIFPVACGAVLGLMGFSRVLSWLLTRYHALTVAALVGFMCGSLHRIWPWKETVSTMLDRHGEVVPLKEINFVPSVITLDVCYAIGLAVLGLIFLLFIDRLANKKQ